MAARVGVSEADLRALLGIVTEHGDDDPGEGLPLTLLQRLMTQVGSDAVVFHGLDSSQQAIWFGQQVPSIEAGGAEDVFWAQYWRCLPCSYPDRSGDVRSVTQNCDFYSARQWHSSGMYTDYLRPAGIEHEIMMCLHCAPGRTVRLLFFRGKGQEFSERDRALLALLRPHLQEVYTDAELRRREVPALTDRHWELLRLVAAGHTNYQIARRLGVSAATVRKHLENIYRRLHVSSRTEAVNRAFVTTPLIPAGERRI